ncbi:hypothetical protein [Intrasporangium sp.]|uniref:hypothetical protein n=1 Tax=Intrasporangium sp. TaxID=1925024 RepID=UPI00293995F2|nr:hypothetical protein [Intrasporangium sp.]MDV3222487.1 hypothetical protein [Intrasporangium sp.]
MRNPFTRSKHPERHEVPDRPPEQADSPGAVVGEKTADDEARADHVVRMLEAAGPSTLAGRSEVLAVAVIHEQPHHTGRSDTEIASLFLDQYKQSGWVPQGLAVTAGTPVAMRHLPEVSRRTQSDINRQLAEILVELAPGAAVEQCAAIGFSGTNPATGLTFFSVLAR